MDSQRRGFEKPNHTQTPNAFFDEHLRQINSFPELKVVLAIIRKTLGWQKERDKISMSQLRDLTGLKQQSVQRGIELALAHGFIDREPAGQQFFYSLKLVTPCDQSHHVTSHTTLPELVTPCDRNQSHHVTNKRKKETTKEINTVPPFQSSVFLTALGEFEQHRKELRHTLTPTSRKRLYAQLEKFGEAKSVRALNLSVEKGWQGVFDPDGRNGNQAPVREHPSWMASAK